MKGQQQAFSAVLITAVLIGVVSSVYLWGMPLIQKNQDRFVLENAENFMKNLDSKIRTVANTGGRETIRVDVPGILEFDGDVLFLRIKTEGTVYSPDQWVRLSLGDCDENVAGQWETAEPLVFCVQSTSPSGEKYENVFKLTYRRLISGSKTYIIELNGANSKGGEDHQVLIESGGTTQNGNLISNVININII